MRTFPIVLLALVACSTSPIPTATNPPAKPSSPHVDVAATAPPTISSEPAPVATIAPILQPVVVEPHPANKTWPWHKWDHAEAVTLNWMPYGPRTSERAYDEDGLSPNIKERVNLDANDAQRALALVLIPKSELLVSKCPNPHNAVIFYDGEKPVASVSVDYKCFDVLLWPSWPSKPMPFQRLEVEAMDSTMRWQGFFQDLHLPLSP